MSLRHLTARTIRTLLFSVMGALVFAQTLSALHRVVHAPHAASAAATGQGQIFRTSTKVIEALFAGHDSEHACDQYDQLNHADLAVGVHAFVVPTTLVEVPVAVHPGWQLAAQAAGFLARGPPAQS